MYSLKKAPKPNNEAAAQAWLSMDWDGLEKQLKDRWPGIKVS
ncbi:hypothetical protein [Candidatus Venteria ishoeyi]|nr:hypothetical protein [Candidatus Venteria ishoeyi]